MTLLLVAVAATAILFIVSMCPTLPTRRGLRQRVAACFRWLTRAFATSDAFDDTLR